MHFQRFVNILEMPANGFFTDEERLPDHLIALPLAQPVEHLDLSGRKQMQGLSGVNSAPLPCAYALYPRVLMYCSHCPPKVNAGP